MPAKKTKKMNHQSLYINDWDYHILLFTSDKKISTFQRLREISQSDVFNTVTTGNTLVCGWRFKMLNKLICNYACSKMETFLHCNNSVLLENIEEIFPCY